MKIQALMPCYKIMEIPAVTSLTALMADCYVKGDHFNIAYANGFNAVHGRTNLVKYSVDNPSDWVLWLDSDHIYKASAMYKLIDRCISEDLDMLSATYFVRGKGKVVAHINKDIETMDRLRKEDLDGSIVEASTIGFGFLVMRWSFLKKMYNRFGKDLFKMDYSDNTTEDVYFCRKVREAGHKVLFDSSVIVGHLTTVVNE